MKLTTLLTTKQSPFGTEVRFTPPPPPVREVLIRAVCENTTVPGCVLLEDHKLIAKNIILNEMLSTLIRSL